MHKVQPVILCGGSGTRLWPLSRDSYPKQFLRLLGNDSLLQQTARRLQSIEGVQPVTLICGESSRFVIAEQMREIGVSGATILLEPARRNTAPAIAASALQALAHGDDPILLVLPSDHVMGDPAAFARAVTVAVKAAEAGDMVTFGVAPTMPETGYGYILAGGSTAGEAHKVVSFVEKPDLATAEKYLADGKYFWNSGMLVFKASSYLAELEQFHPEMLAACRAAVERASKDLDFVRLDAQSYSASPDISVDYAVMERTQKARMVPLDAGWDDIGSWASQNNVVRGDALIEDCQNCLVHGTSRLVTAVGMEDTIIVETADAVLVMKADKAQDVKKIVARLAATDRPEASQHREIFRPWGSYDSIGTGDRFQVKRIKVKPGAKLSLQMHHHRAEHWVVVTGTARVTNGDKDEYLTENQSTYIPLGVVHSLENPGKIPLELIEIQSGGYLGEDDIVRFEDRYGRA
jgi:mannose-1-phosphate guanylyltransferase / mannose-6-phosphate isomerase